MIWRQGKDSKEELDRWTIGDFFDAMDALRWFDRVEREAVKKAQANGNP